MKSGRPFFLALAAAIFLGASAFAAPSPINDVIAVIEMDNVPLPDALRQIARKAHLNILLDPRLSAAPYDRTMVSFRWQNVTAREALTALLENHGLVLVETSRSLSSSADRASSR